MADDPTNTSNPVPAAPAPNPPASTAVGSATTNADAYSARMYDNTNQKWVQIPAHQVDSVAGSGQFTFAPGTRIPLVTPEGQAVTVGAEDAQTAFQRGYKWLTPQLDSATTDAANQKILQDKFDSPTTALAAGILRSSTLGGSDLALQGIDKLTGTNLTDAARTSAQVNPIATAAGEVVGAVAPALSGLGMGAAANAGEGVAAIAKAALGESGVARIATKALQMSAEGAVFGFGSGVSEQALGSPNSVYDSLAAHIGSGALIGGALGGVFGAGAEALPYLSKLASGAADTGATAIQSSARKIAQYAFEKSGVAGADAATATDPALLDVIAKHGMDAVADATKDMHH